jgi:hypothetical protein
MKTLKGGGMTVDELIMEIRAEFEKAISVKTGWGKNEVLKQLDLVIAKVALSALKPIGGMKYHDKNGKQIKDGDTLFNPYDQEPYQMVISDGKGKLFLGDFDSPLERYSPEIFWELK